MFWHIDTDIVGLLVMCALYYYTMKLLPNDGYTARNKSFVWCLRAGIIMTVIDVAASVVMDMPTSRFLYHLLMTAYMLTQDLVIVTWFRYALTILYDDDKRRRLVASVAWLPYFSYCLLVLSNPWSQLFFSLGPQLEYARGPLFLPGLAWLNYAYAAALLLLILRRWRYIPADYPKAVLIMQPLILSAAIFIQLRNPGWLLIYSAYMFCLVLAFLFFQNIRVRSERARLQQLTEEVENFACGLAICHITKEGDLDIQYVSSGLAAICELEAEELRQRLRADLLFGVHPDDRELVACKLGEMTSRQQQQELNYRFVTARGRLKWLHINAKAVERPGGPTTVYATYTDLTELEKAQHMIDVALANTGVSIWEYDFKRRCIIQYQNSTEMHGFERIVPNVPQSLVESGFVHPDSATAFLAMYDKLFRGAAFAEGVFKVQTSDRQGYWYEHIRYTNTFDENGQPYSAVGMSTDETERQEAIAKYERELEKERGFVAEENLLVHATFDLTTGVTLDYCFRDGSPVPEEQRTTFAYSQANAGLLIDTEERARFLALTDKDALLERFAAGESEFRQEYRRKLPDGMVSWVRNTLRLLKDPRSGNVLLFAYWFDIEAEKMLELMYRSIATDNFDYVARIDGRTRRYHALLRENMIDHQPPADGEDADILTRSSYNECVLPEDKQLVIDNCLVDAINAHLREHSRFTFTYRMKRDDGALRYKKVTQYYIDSQRQIIAMLREDITDLIREESEKSRVLSEALGAANQASLAKSQFLSRVSHELRTPLNAIIGFMELAKDADAAQMAAYLANSDAAARQLLSIINDVLDVSSIESGKLKIAHTPFDFRRLIRDINEIYAPQCQQKGLTFETVFQTPVEEWLLGDAVRVNQILLNLLNNALKFTAAGFVRLTVSQRETGGEKVIARFRVEDSGCGMSEEMQQRLFRPFEQESAASAQKYGGTGLGLSIVGSLVNMMGGVVSVESRPQQGSLFTVDIPFMKSAAEVTSGSIEGAESLHVLAVDDEAADREYVSVVLDRIGVRHTCVADGSAALADLAQADQAGDAYNVCLLDWKMPDMNGLEITRRLRKLYGQNLIIIVVSAYDHYQADESVKAAGANLFISKPLFQSSLFDLFATLTNGRIAQRESRQADFSLQNMRILLVEDNAMNRLVAETLIDKKFGAVCESAADGQIALEMFLTSGPGYYDVILMDIQMPNMDGYEATRRIRASAHPDARHIQIIALTANAFSEDVTKSLSCGMNAHVSKPIEPDVLGAALSQALSQRRVS